MTTTVHFVCGACFHWERKEGEGVREIGKAAPGICWGAPPIPRPILSRHGEMMGQQNMRAMTRENERGCGAFLPLAAMQAPPAGANDPEGLPSGPATGPGQGSV